MIYIEIWRPMAVFYYDFPTCHCTKHSCDNKPTKPSQCQCEPKQQKQIITTFQCQHVITITKVLLSIGKVTHFQRNV